MNIYVCQVIIGIMIMQRSYFKRQFAMFSGSFNCVMCCCTRSVVEEFQPRFSACVGEVKLDVRHLSSTQQYQATVSYYVNYNYYYSK